MNTNIKQYSFFLAVLVLSSCAALKYQVANNPLSKHFELNPVFRESHTGLLVYDPETKKVLYNYNAHKHFTPASNTKILTYFAIENILADSIPSIRYCIKNDTLYFTGTGDGTFLYDDFTYSNTFAFLKQSPYPLVYIKKQILDERFGPGWSWDDYPYYFSPEKASFPIYGNMVNAYKDSSKNFVNIVPDIFEDQFKYLYDFQRTDLMRMEFTNQFTLQLDENPIHIDEEIPFIYSDELFIELLADTLNKKIYTQIDYPEGHVETGYSVPTDSVSKQILIDSDNFLAEQMLILISNQFGDTLNSKKSIDFIMENYLTELKDEIYWVDGSGLSRYNLVTPHAMVKVLEHILDMVAQDKLYTLLPESGKTGTLKNSFKNISGHIHAKTGSMSHVYNLSGYLETKSGKTLLFSFMNNNFNVSFTELKGEMEKVLSAFVNDVK